MAEMLKEIEIRTGKKIYEIFDLICGTSTGFKIYFLTHRWIVDIWTFCWSCMCLRVSKWFRLTLLIAMKCILLWGRKSFQSVLMKNYQTLVI
jgi:hypothetical protein